MQNMMEEGWSRRFVFKMIVAAALLLTGGFAVARAATIDFAGGTNPFTSSSPYTENGFTVTPIAGTWSFLNCSARCAVDGALNTNTLQVKVTGGGDFTFSSVDLSQSGGGYYYTIAGFLSGGQVLIQGGQPHSGSLSTVTSLNSSQLLDTLNISFDNGPSAAVANIVVNPASGGSAPEPGTVALMGLGFAALGLARFRRSRARR